MEQLGVLAQLPKRSHMEDVMKGAFSVEGQIDRLDMEIRRLRDAYAQLVNGGGGGKGSVKFQAERVISESLRMEEAMSKLVERVD
eukprot:CAMPEP_0202979536 /NCGR_PEP_ID=MMETSP1396-20130829/85654_1 /ASSEMBLY_ACC=CAM_ASM_000872 /TAXON_ID= /ORGANISM="Pseudokeronopsis sp., Strain Brazil" /LENGTH=84 /DNA_ID=CAMNT_0049718995 /DNA_START=875 /DNA_END=1129 /DNA_ORIENTATION=+